MVLSSSPRPVGGLRVLKMGTVNSVMCPSVSTHSLTYSHGYAPLPFCLEGNPPDKKKRNCSEEKRKLKSDIYMGINKILSCFSSTTKQDKRRKLHTYCLKVATNKIKGRGGEEKSFRLKDTEHITALFGSASVNRCEWMQACCVHFLKRLSGEEQSEVIVINTSVLWYKRTGLTTIGCNLGHILTKICINKKR